MSVGRLRAVVVPSVMLCAVACTSVQTSPARDFVTVDAPLVALTNVRVIDGTGAAGRAGQTIVIREGAIAAVGDSATVAIPAGARVMDLAGRTVVPGYVMLHEHLFAFDGARFVNTAYSFAPLYLAGGATTIRTGGASSLATDVAVRDAIERGELAGPQIDATSPHLGKPGLFEFSSGADRGRGLVEKWAGQGATSFKAYERLTRAELGGVIEEAHRRGLKVTGHLCAVTFSEAAELGIDNLEHGLWVASDFVADKRPDECPPSNVVLEGFLQAGWSSMNRLIAQLVSRNVAITSTLAVFETFVPGRQPASDAALGLMAPAARARYEAHRAEVDGSGQKVWADLLRKEMAFEVAFARAGGLLVTGTDPTGHGGLVAGFSNQRAIQLLVEAGFTVPEAIRIATLNGAQYLGRNDRIGSIARAKQADLVIVRGDPEQRISSLEDVELVFKKGIGYDPAKLTDSVRGLVYAQ
jgi:imidazolonepropionase-like amidohydrolase